MFKQAFRSYVASFHPRNLKKAYDDGKLFWLLYWLVIYPAIMRIVPDNVEYQDVIFLVIIRLIPFFLMEWSNINSKFLMPKVMFLCPMKEKERKEYLNYVLLIKIGVSVLCGVCVEVIWSIFNGFHIWRILIIAIMNLTIGVATYISFETLGKMNRKVYSIVKDKTDNTKNHWINNLAIVCAIAAIASLSILDIGAEESLAFGCKLFIGVMTVGAIVMDVVIISGEYKATIALVGDYELHFNIKGKVEKSKKYDLFAK